MKRHPDDYAFWVYILASRSRTLYIGMTNSLTTRVAQHRKQTPGAFTTRYQITRLVYFEQYQYVNNAIAREKEMKHWTRAQKVELIEACNPTWEDLFTEPISHTYLTKSRFPSGMTKMMDHSYRFVVPAGSTLHFRMHQLTRFKLEGQTNQ